MSFATVPELLESAEHRFGDAPAIITTNDRVAKESLRQEFGHTGGG